MESLGRTWRGRKYAGTELPVFIEANNLKPYIPSDLDLVPRKIITPRGVAAEGFKADMLPAVCDVYLSARSHGALTAAQQKVALECELLVRAFARVGICDSDCINLARLSNHNAINYAFTNGPNSWKPRHIVGQTE